MDKDLNRGLGFADAIEREARLGHWDTQYSAFREKLLEHVFIAELLQEAWLGRAQIVEVLRSEVDAAGYDVVLECGSVVRHIQLKSSRGLTARQTINVRLADKPSSCIVWLVVTERPNVHRFDLRYLYFGGGPGEPLPHLGEVVGINTRSKVQRAGTRVLTKPRFEKIATTALLLDRLFGPAPDVAPLS